MHSKTPFLAVLALVASATCADVKVIWHHAKFHGQTSLSVFDGSDLVAQACSSLITGTPQSQSLDFSDLDANGFGNFSVGDTKYLAHSNPEYSGGPICGKKYNNDVAVVECTGVNWTPPADVDVAIEKSCYEDKNVVETIRLFTSTTRVLANASIGAFAGTAQSKRNESVSGPNCQIVTSIARVGDGNPHQNFYDKQISENIFCGAADQCEAGRSVATSYTIGWTADVTPREWISGGFEVQMTWETGSDYHCTGHTGETVCIWYNTAHTAYTVQNLQMNQCEYENRWSPDGNPFVMYSPNKVNRNGGYYCVVGTCRAKGDAYWDKSGRAGGP